MQDFVHHHHFIQAGSVQRKRHQQQKKSTFQHSHQKRKTTTTTTITDAWDQKEETDVTTEGGQATMDGITSLEMVTVEVPTDTMEREEDNTLYGVVSLQSECVEYGEEITTTAAN